jgi:diadenosine tetraphosphate (Ap4A) HIT family hydrolase
VGGVEMKLFETEFWEVVLLDDQYYLGRSVVVLKRGCGELSGLTSEEALDFLEVVRRMEKALSGSFGATNFNWACLMNHAYKEADPKPQVHWHLWPRYRDKVEFAGEVFEDEVFAHHYDKTRAKVVSKDVLGKIAEELNGKS